MKKKRKSKNAPIFPPETGENKMPSPALQSPANAAAMASSYAGLGSVGSINEEVKTLFPEQTNKDLEEFLDKIRQQIWRSFEEGDKNEDRSS